MTRSCAISLATQSAPTERWTLRGRAKEQLYREMMAGQHRRLLVPGLREFLERHRHLPMAVASNAEPENVAFVLDETGLRQYFRVIVDGHQVAQPETPPRRLPAGGGTTGDRAGRLRCFRGFPFRRGGRGGGGNAGSRLAYYFR